MRLLEWNFVCLLIGASIGIGYAATIQIVFHHDSEWKLNTESSASVTLREEYIYLRNIPMAFQ